MDLYVTEMDFEDGFPMKGHVAELREVVLDFQILLMSTIAIHDQQRVDELEAMYEVEVMHMMEWHPVWRKYAMENSSAMDWQRQEHIHAMDRQHGLKNICAMEEFYAMNFRAIVRQTPEEIHALERLALGPSTAAAERLRIEFLKVIQLIVIIHVYIYLMGFIEKGQWGTYSNGAWEFRSTYVGTELRVGGDTIQKFREVASSHCNPPKPIGVYLRRIKHGVVKPYYKLRVNIIQGGKSVRLPVRGYRTLGMAALIRDVAVFCLSIKTHSGLNADTRVYSSLAPISCDLPHTQIAELVVERVHLVDQQAFKASFDERASPDQEHRHPLQAPRGALNAPQCQGLSEGDRVPESQPGNGCSGQTEDPESESLRRAPQEPSDNPGVQGTCNTQSEMWNKLVDFHHLQVSPVIDNPNPEQAEGHELSMCGQESMARQDGQQNQGLWQPTSAVNVGSHELVGGEPNISMSQGRLRFGSNDSILQPPTSANSPAIQQEGYGFIIMGPSNNQVHVLTTPILNAICSLRDFSLGGWGVTDTMTTSERVIRIQKSSCVEDFELSPAMSECLHRFATLPGWKVLGFVGASCIRNT